MDLDIMKDPSMVFVAGLALLLAGLALGTFGVWYFRHRVRIPEGLLAPDSEANSVFKSKAQYLVTFFKGTRRHFSCGGFRFRGEGLFYLTEKGAHFSFADQRAVLCIPAEMIYAADQAPLPIGPKSGLPGLKIAWNLLAAELETFIRFEAESLPAALEEIKKLAGKPGERESETV